MSTIAEMTRATGVVVETGHDLDFEIPVLTGAQRQGDTLAIPRGTRHYDGTPYSFTRLSTPVTPVPAQGCPVVRGENGGNTHAIFADGPGVLCDTFPGSATSLTIAALLVPEGSEAYEGHPEHAFNGFAPGRYLFNRQREMAEQLRVVTD